MRVAACQRSEQRRSPNIHSEAGACKYEKKDRKEKREKENERYREEKERETDNVCMNLSQVAV